MTSTSKPRQLTVGLAQIAPRLGDVDANLNKHLQFTSEAANQGVELLLFPELSLTGYSLQDLTAEVACHPSVDDPVFAPLLEAGTLHKMDLVVGFVEEDIRYRYHIAAAYLSDGRIVHVHRKVYLPTYGLFDEGRYFGAGHQIRAFETRWGRTGMLICEDFWHMSPPYLLWLDGADLMLFMSASPGRGLPHGSKPRSHAADDSLGAVGGRLDSTRFVERIHQSYAAAFTCFVIHCNRVGYEDGVNFWGGSTCFGPDGELITQAPYFEESLVTATLDLAMLRRVRQRLPLLRDERPELTLRELQRITSGK
ncbi:MAG TPA: acyltransferase [Anaerolineae bacterium]|nr:acyltransferase [Anaerolineae bacterium]HIQ04121.1 acyltransferase [Anaerolineae bacterium]